MDLGRNGFRNYSGWTGGIGNRLLIKINELALYSYKQRINPVYFFRSSLAFASRFDHRAAIGLGLRDLDHHCLMLIRDVAEQLAARGKLDPRGQHPRNALRQKHRTILAIESANETMSPPPDQCRRTTSSSVRLISRSKERATM